MTSETPPISLPPPEGSYKDPQAALQAVGAWFDSWTRQLSDRSIELSYAIIGANWAVFGSTGKLLSSPYAKVSIAASVLFLGLNLGLTSLIASRLRDRFAYAEDNPVRWKGEFEKSKGKNSPWPSTKGIDNTASILRLVRTWLPLIAGGSLLLGILASSG